ncbi:MAG: SemiSWEET family sugar transporter [Flavobacteriaceae bacterium]|jgi:MtN3 and saliva related transmembrane protein|tara:strand:- start:381 stop:641 length:261 start_codon:yes stop_codon:yes gene_type:complete
MIDQNEIIGLIAAVCTTFAFIPQVMKVWKTKQTKDLSLRMYSIMFIGIILWLVYGIRIDSLSIIMANVVTATLVGTILVYIIKGKQ